VFPPEVITPLQGMQQRVPQVIYADGSDPAKSLAAAQEADLAIVVVGYTYSEEGEFISGIPLVIKEKGGDRRSLRLSTMDEELILSVVAANPRTVVVLECGSAVIMEAWRERVPAILVLWYPGMEGGHALANLLFGDANPSGKLPCVFPKSDDQLPFFDSNAEEIEYDLYHGYRLMDKRGETPAFPFGYGLSYTTFAIDELQIEQVVLRMDESVRVSARVRNTGSLAGAEVVQLYVGCDKSIYDRPVKELKGFQKIHLQPGEERRVTFDLPAQALAVWDGEWKVEPGNYRLWLSNSSRSEDALIVEFQID